MQNQNSTNEGTFVTSGNSVLENERRKKLFEKYLHSEEYQKKLKQRIQINEVCGGNLNSEKTRHARHVTKALLSREDNPVEGIIFLIETFGWTFDPRPQANPNHLPFILFEYQKELIRWLVDHIDNGKDGLVEKSRDMGASWIVFVWVVLWYWLFKDGINFLLGSYKQDLVDNRGKDSLFGMIDYALDNLPKWILPARFDVNRHRNQMKLTNPANFNLITGDTMNPDFGRGSRKTAVLFDELASWDYAREAWESTSDVTACKIGVSTPKGINFFAKLRNSGIDVFTMHWRNHPLKDEQWYQFEKSRRTEEEVAQELDISYNKSQEGRVYPEWNDQNVEFGYFPYDEELPLYIGWDFGNSDSTAVIWCQPDKDGFKIIDTYTNAGKTIDFYIPFVSGMISSETYGYNKRDLEVIEEHKYWKRGTHFGDPAGRFTSAVTNTSVLDVLRESGIIVNFRDEWKEFQKRKTAAKLMIREAIKINKNPRTDYFNLCMSQASYPKVSMGGEKEVRSVKPIHNFTSHYRSSFEYLALGLSEFKQQRRMPYDKFKINRNIDRAVAY